MNINNFAAKSKWSDFLNRTWACVIICGGEGSVVPGNCAGMRCSEWWYQTFSPHCGYFFYCLSLIMVFCSCVLLKIVPP